MAYTPTGEYLLDWDLTGADGSASLPSSGSNPAVGVTVSTPDNGDGQEFFLRSDGLLESKDVQSPTETIIEFDSEVADVNFEIEDIDQGYDWDDKITILAYDKDGNLVEVEFENLDASHVVTDNSVEGSTNLDDPVRTDADNVTVKIAGPITKLVIVHDNGADDDTSGHVYISDLGFSAVDDNDDPDATDDSTSTEEGDAINIDVLANDTDPDGDPLDILTTTPPTNGSITVEADDTITYTPDPGFTGTDSFTYTVTDGNGGTDTATVTVTVTPDGVNTVVANDDAYTIDEDTTLIVDVRANDSDPQGDDFNVTAVGPATNGTATLLGDGTVKYVPDADFNGTDTFTYTITDDFGATDTATVTITVDPVSDVPDAENDVALTDEDTAVTIPVLDNDSDADGDPLEVLTTTPPANGSIVVEVDDTITYTPDAGFTGTDTFTYTITDGTGETDTATVTVVVGDVDDNTVDAVDDTANTTAGTPVEITVLGNDTDPQGDDFGVSGFTNGANGSVTADADGKLTYTPDAGFTGTDTFTYTVTDEFGATDTATVTVTVGPAGANSVDAVDDAYTIDEDTTLIVDVRANDSDPEGDDFEVTAVGPATNGTATLLGDGTVKYVPDADFNGTDTFTYTITDDFGATDTATVTITVDPVSDVPDAENDVALTDEDTPVTIPVLDNDSDADGDPLEVLTTTPPANGSIVVEVDDTITYTPDAGFTGTDTFTYTITDGTGETDTATVTVVVGDVDDNTVDAVDDTANTTAGTPVEITVLGNDTDPQGDDFGVSGFTNGANGSVTADADGKLTYTPDAGFTGTDTFTYTVTDEFGATDTATVTVTVGPAGANSVDAVDDAYTIDEDTTLIVDVRANDSDPQGDDFNVTAVGPATNGTATLLGDGTVKYVPDADFNGTDTFTYTITDDFGATDTATVTITVDPVSDVPDAENDVALTDEDTPVTIPVLDNDSDADGDPLEVLTTTPPANGSIVVEVDDTITYTPDAGFTGTDTFTYTITDGTGETDTATVTVVVGDVPDPTNSVKAVDDSYTIDEDSTLIVDLTANDSDPQGDDYEVTSVGTPAHGTATLLADGTVQYKPDPDYYGTDTFTYVITDDKGATDTATVTINVDPVNDDPDAEDDIRVTEDATPIEIQVLDNDSDPDGDPLEVLTYTPALNGSLSLNPDGSFVYTPNAGFTGTDTFTYAITDGNGGNDTAKVTIAVRPDGVNEVVAIDDTSTTATNTAVDIPVLDNDSDPEGDSFSVTGATDGANGSTVVNGDGTISYTPDFGFTGTDTFTYTIEDDFGATDTATVTVRVSDGGVNTVDAVDDSVSTDEDTAIIVDVTGNDSDPEGDSFKVISVGTPGNGTAEILPDGTVKYTPDADYTGTDTFTYTIEDALGATDTAIVSVAVQPVNEVDAVDDTASTTVGTPVLVDALANDSDPEGDAFDVISNTDPSNGSVVDNGDGTFTYTPDAGYTGTDTFTYTVEDALGATDTAKVTVAVGLGPNSTDAVDDAYEIDEDSALYVDPTVNDTDPEGHPQTITGVGAAPNGTATLLPDGTVKYVPDPDFYGTDTFTYTITDGNGATDTATITVTVNPVNDAPDAEDDLGLTDEGTPVVIDVTGNDSDPDGDPLTITLITTPGNGGVTDNGDGTVTYTPDPGFEGTDTFDYTISDGNGETDTATVTVVVDASGPNTVDAVDDSYSIDEDTTLIVDLTVNDTDPQGDDIDVLSVGTPTNGTATLLGDGTVKYVPNKDYTGTDTFTYTVTDGKGATDTATVSIDLAPVNDDPDAEDDVRVIEENNPINIPVLNNDNDVDGDPLDVISTTPPTNGAIVVEADDTITYTPNTDFTGTDTFTYTISDGNGGTDTATVTVVVNPDNGVNEVDAVDDTEDTYEDLPVDIAVLANDSDPEGDAFSILSNTNPTNGSVTNNGDGTFTYTPNTGFTGSDTFTYTIQDTKGATDTATVTVNVAAGNSTDAQDDTASTDLNTAVDIDVLANDVDPQGDTQTVLSNTNPTNGVALDNGDGTFTYTPNTGFTGTDSFTYTITDGAGATDTATVSVSVGVGMPPIANDDTDKTPINTPVNIVVLSNDSDPDGDDSKLEVISATSPDGTPSINTDGSISFTPATDFTGYATINYTIEDEDGLTDTATVTILVNDGIVEGTSGDDIIDKNYLGDPELDLVDANDNIFPGKGPDDDIIESYEGDDIIKAGDGDDDVTSGDGSDVVFGEDGDDIIDTSAPTEASDHGFVPGETVDNWPFDPLTPYDLVPLDADPDNDKDVVDGGAGNDTIFTGDDADIIRGGDGNDTIDGGLDDDTILGGADDDEIIGGHGADNIDGGTGNDTIYGGLGPSTPDILDLEDDAYPVDDYGDADTNDPLSPIPSFLDPRPENGKDIISGGEGDDVIYGQDDDDILYGDEGKDFIDGGIDDDRIFGGEDDDELYGDKGRDFIDGGEGEDDAYGGDDQDYFVNVNPGDFVDGGEGGDDWDTLDLIGTAPTDGSLKVTLDGSNPENGTVEFFDKDGKSTGTMSFINIEDIVPCFTPGTLIATPKGEVPVQDLQEGDRIITRDNGIQEIRWIGKKSMDWRLLNKSQHLKPVLIKAGSLGNNLPERDMLVSPNHRMLVANDRTALYFDEREVLASAKHLVDNQGIMSVDVPEVTYIHFLFDNHEVVLSDGTWTESFQPGDYSLNGIGNAQRQELFELFPELETREGIDNFTAARRILKKHEAKMLRR